MPLQFTYQGFAAACSLQLLKSHVHSRSLPFYMVTRLFLFRLCECPEH